MNERQFSRMTSALWNGHGVVQSGLARGTNVRFGHSRLISTQFDLSNFSDMRDLPHASKPCPLLGRIKEDTSGGEGSTAEGEGWDKTAVRRSAAEWRVSDEAAIQFNGTGHSMTEKDRPIGC